MPRKRALRAPLLALIFVTIAVLTSGAQRRQMDPLTASSKQTMHQSRLAADRIGTSSEVFAGIPTAGTSALTPSTVDASGIFLEGRLFNSGGNGISNLAVADLNGDGKLDVV